jgi:hypothetical protein
VSDDRPAREADVHVLALGMPHVTVWRGSRGNAVYQVGGKSFVFFRTPRPDAVDADTGEKLPDVIMFWVESQADKLALVPLALRGVRYTPASASAMLRRNLLVYGLGGIVLPFVGIKLIDLLVSLLPGIS